MPIYDYVCKDCGHKTTEIRKYIEKDEPCECEKCSSQNTERDTVPAATTFILKGKGWAKDNYGG